ncbi:MAG: hypothetical protein JOZ67_02130 [Gammaproteobacteria bacterium]|nr:hypothetical protein [Gammaproteobacteria bacterium]
MLATLVGGLCAAGSGAQTSQPSPSSSDRPDAVYAQPSGQDSAPKSRPAPSPGVKGPSTAAGVATHPAPYRGNSGRKKQDAAASTACSTARLKKNGQLDCGTGGDAATAGKIVTK